MGEIAITNKISFDLDQYLFYEANTELFNKLSSQFTQQLLVDIIGIMLKIC